MKLRNLNQKAVVWTITGRNRFGEYTVTTGREISVRVEKALTESLDPQGNKVTYPMIMYVGETLTIGDLVWVGEADDLPSPVTDVMQVVDYEEIPDIKGNNFVRSVTLQRDTETNADLTV